MGVPIAPVVDLAMCVVFHICTVNNGYQNQRMKLCPDNTAVLPEQKCPKAVNQQQNATQAATPQAVPQPQPQGADEDPPEHD